MNALEVKHQLYLRKWSAELEEFRQSGMTVKDWCHVKGIAPSTFSMHRRAVRSAACIAAEETTGRSITDLIRCDAHTLPISNENATINLAQIHLESPAPHDTGIHIKRGQVEIDIAAGASTDQLKTLLEVLLHAE